MKKFSLIILSVLFIQIGRAQTQITTTTTTTDLTINSATATEVPDKNAQIIVTPFLCDYKMLTKEAVYDTINSKILVKTITNNAKFWIDQYETLVMSKMMRKYGADAIFSPTKEAQTSAKGELIIIVRGYPVKYVNFRPATKDDEWMWKWDANYNAPTTKTSTGTTVTNK